MIAILVDQNFNEHILNGMIRRAADLDVIHVREIGLAKAADPEILLWAATHHRVLLTHDRKTIPRFAYERVASGAPMPGVFLVSGDMLVSQAVDELFVAVHCLTEEECANVVRYFPT